MESNQTDTMNNSTISYLTDTQERVLALLPVIPALLSILGSTCLIRLLLKASLQKPSRRILLGMSLYDILNSVTVVLQSYLVPEETSRRIWAVGNDASCSAMGFLFQFSYPSFMYFGCLSVYHVAVVRFRIRDEVFSKRIEPVLHCIALLWPTATAILGLSKNVYGELPIGAGCWISESSPAALDGVCDDACVEKWSWIMGGLPFFLVFPLVLINNAVIFCHVRTTVRRVTRRSSFAAQPEMQESKIRAVGVQALLYCGVFVLTYCWTIVLRLSSNNGAGPPQEPRLFPIICLRSIFLPAMGLGTLLVYSRPRYMALRSQNRDQSRWWTLRRVLWEGETAGAGSTPLERAAMGAENIVRRVEKGGDGGPSVQNSSTRTVLTSTSPRNSVEGDCISSMKL